MQIRLLGGFGVERGGQSVQPGTWRLRKARTLVKLLALTRDQRLHREVLLDSLWPDRDPTSAVNNLHQALHIARRALAGNASSDGWLELRDDVVSLNADGLVDVDVRRFEQLAALARSSGNLTDLRAAVAAYTGDLLPEDRFEDWAARPREELRASSATSSSTSRTPSGRPGTRQRQSTRCSARSRPIHSTSVPSGA